GMFRTLIHGAIQHGTQFFGSDEDRTNPTAYYVHDSGIGLALDLCCKNRPRRVGVIGLGAGTLAAYGRPSDVFRFYEIDPRVETIAHNVLLTCGTRERRLKSRLAMRACPWKQRRRSVMT